MPSSWNRAVSRGRRSRLRGAIAGVVTLVAVTAGYGQAHGQAPAQSGRPSAIHPDPRYLDRPAGVPVLTLSRDAASAKATAIELRRRFKGARPMATLGQASGSPEAVFGKVLGAAFDSRGRLFVLDGAFDEVRVFEPDGRYVTTVGGQGEGPGELSRPAGMTVRDDRLLVGEQSFEIEIYGIGDDAVRYRRTVRTKSVPIHDLCATDAGFIVQGERFDPSLTEPGLPLVHVLDEEGAVRRSFGALYDSPSPLVNHRFADDWMRCVPGQDRVVLAPKAGLGEVRSYSFAGELRWIAEIEGFLSPRILGYGEGRSTTYRTELPSEGFDVIESIQQVDARDMLVQVGRAVLDARTRTPQVESVRSYLIDVDTGRGDYLGDDLPVVIAADGRRFAALETVDDAPEPFPRVHILEWAAPVAGWGKVE